MQLSTLKHSGVGLLYKSLTHHGDPEHDDEGHGGEADHDHGHGPGREEVLAEGLRLGRVLLGAHNWGEADVRGVPSNLLSFLPIKSLYLGSIMRLVPPSMLVLSVCLVSLSTVSFRS